MAAPSPLRVRTCRAHERRMHPCRTLRARQARASDDDGRSRRSGYRARHGRSRRGNGGRFALRERVRVQLRTGADRLARLRPLLVVPTLASLLTTAPVHAAGGADPVPKVEDTATERAGMEFATYGDSDHVTVITPSIHGTIENASGATLSGSYLVDVVSAASADIVSTASSRWQEVRQAGVISGTYKPHNFGVGVGGSVSSEPDYLSYGGHAMIIADFDQKNWTLTLGYGFSHDTAGRCGTGGQCTPFSVFSRTLQRGSFNAGIAWVVDHESLASAT